MNLLQAAILGLVQGLTEFLPISSTAHIRILPALLGWKDPGAPFTAAIQIGTTLAVLLYFRKELIGALSGWLGSLTGKNFKAEEARMGWAVVLGTVPIVAAGVLFKGSIEGGLRSLVVVAWALIGMGLVLLFAELYGTLRREERDVRPLDGVWVGLWQAVALIPGASRSGSSIAGALFAGFDRPAAARFSFLLSVPSVLAAAVYSILKHRHELLEQSLGPLILANAVAFVSGYAAIAFLISYLQRRGTFVFVAYRVLLGAAILVLLGSGVLSADAGMAGP